MKTANQDSSMKLKLFLAWGFVGIPLMGRSANAQQRDEAIPVAPNKPEMWVAAGRRAGGFFVDAAAGLAHNSLVPGETRMYIADTKRLTHEGARKMMAVAADKAREAKIAISCCIVDAGGHVVVLERMDGGRFHTLHSCTTKAVCAASNKRPTSA